MNKCIFFICFNCGKLVVGSSEIQKETDKLYFLPTIIPELNTRILRKKDENIIDDEISWTTDEQALSRLRIAFVLARYNYLKGALAQDKAALKALRKEAKELKIKVKI